MKVNLLSSSGRSLRIFSSKIKIGKTSPPRDSRGLSFTLKSRLNQRTLLKKYLYFELSRLERSASSFGYGSKKTCPKRYSVLYFLA